MTTSPYGCIVCGIDLTFARKPWRAIEHAAGMSFVCEEHPAGDVRDAVLSVERPDVLDGGEPAALVTAAAPTDRIEFPGDGADSTAVTVVRRDHPTWGREVFIGPAVFGVAGESTGPETLRALASVLEFSAVSAEPGCPSGGHRAGCRIVEVPHVGGYSWSASILRFHECIACPTCGAFPNQMHDLPCGPGTNPFEEVA